MPVLAERTKILIGPGAIASTTGLNDTRRAPSLINDPDEVAIDTNAYSMTSTSIRIQAQQYIPELSLRAKEVLIKLSGFRLLKNNWDGEGAIAPDKEVINMATRFLSLADGSDLPIYFTAPGPNGEIVLEYKNGENMAEVFFEENDHSEMVLYEEKKQMYAGEVQLQLLIDHLS